ncbi:MAG: AbiEi antitoxin N-terminal domain-containing protein [Deltaproteobacteria bacterium]|nr:AbiEi antitoxin N-terminal domain-containing protein [Deltaproteobacteria bacterium]
MEKTRTGEDRVLALARNKGVLRLKDLKEEGIHPENLRRLVKRGRLVKIARGLYEAPDKEISADHSLVLASKRLPDGIICLLSALRFHELGSQDPFEVWIALDRRAAKPKIGFPPLRVMRFSGGALTEGIEKHEIEGVVVRVYTPSKTVADCFKFRNKIGLDVALEALRDCKRQKKCSNDDLYRFAGVCRVWSVMKSYLEAMS